MMLLSEEEYFDYYYEHGKCIDDLFNNKAKFNEKQLKTRYKKYVIKSQAKEEKNKIKRDEKWDELKVNIPNKCALISKLVSDKRYSEAQMIREKGTFLVDTIDGAHVISRQKAPFMKYDIDNVVPLNRYSHSMLDFLKNPIYGTPISVEDQEQWWIYIIGEERWNRLNKKYKKGVSDV